VIDEIPADWLADGGEFTFEAAFDTRPTSERRQRAFSIAAQAAR
jgi:hypothetical protein